MVKDGEDWQGLQTTNLKNLGLIFKDDQTVTSENNSRQIRLIT